MFFRPCLLAMVATVLTGLAATQTMPSPAPNNPSVATGTPAAPKKPAAPDPLLDPPPLPEGAVSLLGGTLVRLDPVLNRIVMTPFLGKRREIAFDVRTQFLQDGKKISTRDLKPGTRIYADTIWDGSRIFAKSVRVFTGEVHKDQQHGQIVSFDPSSGTLRVRDELFPEPMELKVTSSTVIRKDQSAATAADLRPGALVSVNFQPGNKGLAHEINVLATPGASFTFEGPLTHLDLLSHVLAISNRTDSIIYDIHFDPARIPITADLQEGAEVNVNATFDGNKYLANTVTIRSSRQSQ